VSCGHNKRFYEPIRFAYLAWLALKVRAKHAATTVYAAKSNLLRDFLRAELRRPTIRAYRVA
jgi:hypothetical protein